MAAGLPTYAAEIEFTAGVWTDVAAYVIEGQIEQGTDTGDYQPGTCTLLLDNGPDTTGANTGRFTPDNPLSPYYPNVVEGRRLRVTITKGASSSVRFIGEITAWLPEFDRDPYSGRVQVEAADLMADLARVNLRSAIDAESLALGPVAYWPLTAANPQADDSEDVVGTADLTPTRYEPDAGSGLTGSIERGAALGSEQIEVTRFGGDGTEYRLDACPMGGGVSVPVRGFSLSMWVRYEDRAGGSPNFISLGSGAPQNGGNYIAIYTDTNLTPTVKFFGLIASTVAGGTIVRGRWHHLAYTHSTGDTAKLYLDGTLVATQASATPGWSTLRLNSVSVSYEPFANFGFVGSIGGLALYDYELTSTEVGYINSAGRYRESRTTADLLSRISALTGVTVAMDTTTSRDAVQPATLGRSALDVVAVIADGLGRVVQHRPDTSQVTVLAPESMRPATVALTLDAEADLAGAPQFGRDARRRLSAVTVETSARTTTYTDPDLVNEIGYPADQVETALSGYTAALAVAQDRMALGASQRLRIRSATLDLGTAANNRYAAWFATTLGERVRIENLLDDVTGFSYSDGFLVKYIESFSASTYEVELYLDAADAPPEGLWGDSEYGRWGWGDGVCTLSGSLTAGATSVTLTWTGSAVMSTTGGDYPLDIDVNGERMTITSAPAGGSSPQTVTVTRGVAPTVARAHSSGEAVDIWNAARWAM